MTLLHIYKMSMQLTLRLGCACNVAESLQFILCYSLSFLFLLLLKLVLHRVCSIRCEHFSKRTHTYTHTNSHTLLNLVLKELCLVYSFKEKAGRKILCWTRNTNLRQCCAWLFSWTLHQLSFPGVQTRSTLLEVNRAQISWIWHINKTNKRQAHTKKGRRWKKSETSQILCRNKKHGIQVSAFTAHFNFVEEKTHDTCQCKLKVQEETLFFFFFFF